MLATLTVLLVAADPASLESARAQLGALKFEPALQTASQVLQTGGASPDATAELHFIMGQAASVLGRADEAQASFARALELQPGLTLPPGASPRLNEPFRAAQKQVGATRLSAKTSSELAGAGHVRIRVEVVGDPMGMVARGVVHHGFPEAPVDTPLAATLPPEAAIDCAAPPCAFTLTLMDLRGNALLAAGTEAQPLLTVAPAAVAAVASPPPVAAPAPVVVAPAAEPEGPSKPFFQRPIPYFVGAVVLAAGAGVFGWQFSAADAQVGGIDANRATYFYRDIQAADTARQAWLGATIASAVLAVALAAIGIAVW